MSDNASGSTVTPVPGGVFVSMRWKIVIRVTGAFFVLIGSLYIGGYALECHRAQFAGALVEQLRHLETGKATEFQIKRLAEQFDGKYSETHQENGMRRPASYDFEIFAPYALIAGSAHTLPGRRPMGIRWGSLGSVVLRGLWRHT